MKAVVTIDACTVWFSYMHAMTCRKNARVHAIRLCFCSRDAVAAMEAADNDGEQAKLFAIQDNSCAVAEARKKFLKRITDAGFTRRADELSSVLCHLHSTQMAISGQSTRFCRQSGTSAVRGESNDAIGPL